ncbi:MAG: hypothetical protein Q9187_007381, partial [Circinaria calcarea]
MSQAPFPLMKLPQELQNMVYRAHVTLPDEVTPVIIPTSSMPYFDKYFPVIGLYAEDYQDRRILGFRHPRFPPSVLDFLLVCRKVYIDCRTLFYDSNVFFFPSMNLFSSFLREVDLPRLQYLRSIEVHYWSQRGASDALQLLSQAERFENLVLHIGHGVLRQTPQEHFSHTRSPDLVLDTVIAGRGLSLDNIVHEDSYYLV